MIYILDASALLNSESFVFSGKNIYYTTSKVFSEWKDFRSKSLASNAVSSGLLVVQDPCPLSIQKTISECEKSGTKLSEPDISIVALAAEFKGRGEDFVVVTDDYSVQNVLKKFKARFVSVAQGEIKRARNFSRKKD
jgi:rRNA maturation endonuclease Nob1